MQQNTELRPWSKLSELIESESGQHDLESYIESLHVNDFVLAVSHLSKDQRVALLSRLSPEYAAYMLEEVPDYQATSLIESIPVKTAAIILDEMQSDLKADLLSELDKEDAQAILAAMDPDEAEDARLLISYDAEEAGGLMITEYLSFQDSFTVGDVIDDLSTNAEEYADYDVQYAYVINKQEQLVGVLRMRDLLLSPRTTPLTQIMIRNPLSVSDHASLEILADFFDEHNFFGAPVTDKNGKLIGIILRKDIQEAIAERSDLDHLRAQGLVEEELRTMPVWLRARRRLSWLSINIILNLFAATVVAMYQDTLSSAITLAVFLPIISDMSGCSGNQAVAVSMRELSLGVIKPFEVLRVCFQELSVGIINGAVLGVLLAILAIIWKGNFYLGAVVGGALCCNTLIAVLIGGSVPLVLKRFGFDPALASSPILTTVTDMMGFFLVFSFATSVLSQISGI